MRYRNTPVIAAALAGVLTGSLFGPVAAAQDCDQQGMGGSQIVGTLLGAAVGGLLGSAIGGGSGKKIAIGAGALAGGLLGNRIGQSLDCDERKRHAATAQSAFEHERTGSTASWQNPDSGHTGTITPTRTFQRADGQYCRDFTQTITIDGRLEEAKGTACRQGDGTWRIMS